MVDIHSHLLYSVDDGSDNLEESIAMLHIAEEHGTSSIIATPHFIVPAEFIEFGIINRVKDLAEKYSLRGGKIGLYPGAEIYTDNRLYDFLLSYSTFRLPTLNNTDYLLVEFNFEDNFSSVKKFIEFYNMAGYKIIVAHPERYSFSKNDPQPLIWLIEHSCLLQVNKGSVDGKFGFSAKQISRFILDNRMASFIASDSHGSYHRTPSLSDEYDIICELYGSDYADYLFKENGENVIKNKVVQRF